MYYCCGITDKGIEKHNEDSMLIGRYVTSQGSYEQKLNAPFISAVADGVSNELSGEMASKLCLELVRNIESAKCTNLEKNLMEVHKNLAKFGRENTDFYNMQSTLCGIAVDKEENVYSFNSGDSRLYLFHDGNIRQITRDQSLVQLMYEEGTISFAQKKNHVHKNIIFPAFGNLKSDPKTDIIQIDRISYGDILLLCTDGLSDYLSTSDMQDILELPKSLPVRLEMLVKLAVEKKSHDNITAVAVVYTEK